MNVRLFGYCNVNTEAIQQNNGFAAVRRNYASSPVLLFLISFGLLALQATWPEFWFLALFSLVPLFFAIKKITERDIQQLDSPSGKKRGAGRNAIGAVVVGFAYFSVVIYPISTLNTWWWTVSSGFFWENKALVFFAFGLGLSLIFGLFIFGPVFFIYAKCLKNRVRLPLLILPVVWTFLEMTRVKIFGGLQWGIFGQSLGENLFFARSTGFGGIFVLSFIAVLFNLCVFSILESFIEKKRKKTVAPLSVILIALAALTLNNYSALSAGPPADKKTEIPGGSEIKLDSGQTKLDIGIINPNVKTADIASPSGTEHILDLIAGAAAGYPELVITPENILPAIVIDEETGLPIDYDAGAGAGAFDRLTEISARYPRTSFIIGLHTSKNGRRFNSAVVFEAGKIVSVYNKQNLLPFTEKSFSFLESVHIEPLTSGRNKDGENKTVIETQYGKFSPLICSEVLISQKPQDSIAFINLSNDNVFDSERIAPLNKMTARLRAIENRKPLIRSSKGGFSGIFDQNGAELPSKTGGNGEWGDEIIAVSLIIP